MLVIMNTTFSLVGLCALGAEHILGNEIKRFGWHLTGGAPGRVSFTCGSTDDIRMANVALRTCDRVLLKLAECHTETFDDLFDCVYLIDWQDFFRKDCRVTVDKARTHYSMLESTRSIQAVVQKAIYTKLGDKWHITTLPETGSTHNVRVYIENDVAEVLLDLSGEPLHKRGYRCGGGAGGIAPLRETIAAVMLQEMLWRRKTVLLDPFCGSGTIVAEAALYAYDIAPGLCRGYALEQLACHDAARMRELRRRLAEAIRTDVRVRISGSDIDASSVERAKANIERALSMAGRALQGIGRNDKITRPTLAVADALDGSALTDAQRLGSGNDNMDEDNRGLIITNPPYGERLGDEEAARSLYRKMAVMWEHYPHWKFGILTPCKDFEMLAAHNATRVRNLKAGNLDTVLYVYDESRPVKGKRHGGKGNDSRRT